MNKRINGMDVIHTDKETGEIICETTGCTQIKDNELSEKEYSIINKIDLLEIWYSEFNKIDKILGSRLF